ncbi:MULTISPECIES: hypothetical protein [unclassified Anaeromyxobacter]|uniref:hypothetical protein n=1 Tax=unclassified Anaeromyxobacter TaxID=2620896 RepID=UPI001F5AD762|nr:MULTISPECIES: hypothetical protein [unclassified Anaeromyxobacter]
MLARPIPFGLAALMTASVAAASDLPPHAGSHDDVTYGDISRSSFDVALARPDGATGVGSPYDDTRYAAPEERTSAVAARERRTHDRATCTCCKA